MTKVSGFQPNTTDVTTYYSQFSKKKSTFLSLVKFGWSQSPVLVIIYNKPHYESGKDIYLSL